MEDGRRNGNWKIRCKIETRKNGFVDISWLSFISSATAVFHHHEKNGMEHKYVRSPLN